MRSDETYMERFVDLFVKMDELHQSDFREIRLESKGDFEIAYYAVMGTRLTTYLRKFIIFQSGVYIFHMITPYILFQ